MKIDSPLCPILDMNNSLFHVIAKWLAEILGPVRNQLNIYTVAESYDFANSIAGVSVTGNKMTSINNTFL